MNNTITIPKKDLNDILHGEDVEGYELVQDNITSTDEYDGGGRHEAVIKDLSTGKFYSCSFTDWDIDYEKGGYFDNGKQIIEGDLDNELLEVFPKQKTITVYE